FRRGCAACDRRDRSATRCRKRVAIRSCAISQTRPCSTCSGCKETTMRKTSALAALACALLASAAPTRAADVTYERLLNPDKEPQNWLMNHRDFGAHRYSPLDIINTSNVKNMRLLFAVALGGTAGNEALEATPVVDDGFMYV